MEQHVDARRRPAVWVALAALYLIWGSTYLGIEVAMRTLPPLLMLSLRFLVAGAVLSFSFAMLEVSDSLILALKEDYYPITKAIYVLLGRIADGPYIASAMGMLGLLLLGGTLFIAGRFFGRRMGELFRA